MHETQRSFDPGAELEAAVYILQNGGDYRAAYDSFRELYNAGHLREEALFLLTGAFYEPNIGPLQSRYEKNRRLLEGYPWLFRKDFPAFEALPIRFYPYDDKRYCRFFVEEGRFDEPADFRREVISRNFFNNLEKPILAAELFSQYELEYLKDNVRPSEWVGRENHIYLHYQDWGTFCAHLQVLDMGKLLGDRQFVFLIGDELEQYPIDFKARFGVDYSQYPVKPVGLREIHRLIWHTQLSAHNGGDYFNEIFDGHPNLIALDSIMMDSVLKTVAQVKTALKKGMDLRKLEAGSSAKAELRQRLTELRKLKKPTEKDMFLAFYIPLANTERLDPASRIVPAVFFQPHFSKYTPRLTLDAQGQLVSQGEESRIMEETAAFRGFKYIKTFTPLRRPTTSLAATVRFMRVQHNNRGTAPARGVHDELAARLLQRSYLADMENRLFRDSVIVRFEDAKREPDACFRALAAFLDLPYTESMTCCSIQGRLRADGFRTDTVEARYEAYLGSDERWLLEYFLRDAYEFYGYDFQNYDGQVPDETRLRELILGLKGFTDFIREAQEAVLRREVPEQEVPARLEAYMSDVATLRLNAAKLLSLGLRFVSKDGEPLQMTPMLQLDPALMERPLYH